MVKLPVLRSREWIPQNRWPSALLEAMRPHWFAFSSRTSTEKVSLLVMGACCLGTWYWRYHGKLIHHHPKSISNHSYNFISMSVALSGKWHWHQQCSPLLRSGNPETALPTPPANFVQRTASSLPLTFTWPPTWVWPWCWGPPTSQPGPSHERWQHPCGPE